MARACTVCAHPDRDAIDRLLAAGETPKRRIAAQYGLSDSSLRRHGGKCISTAIVQAVQAVKVANGADLLDRLRTMSEHSQDILREAREGYSKVLKVDGRGRIIRATVKDHDLALRALQRLESQLELEARLLGELKDKQVVNVLISPEWLRVKAALTEALAPFPEARAAVAQQLAALDEPSG